MPLSLSNVSNFLKYFILLIFIFSFLHCSASRYTKEETRNYNSVSPAVRILLNEPAASLKLDVNDEVILFAGGKEIGRKTGRGELLFEEKGGLNLTDGRAKYEADYFLLRPVRNFFFNDKKLAGDIKVLSDGKKVYLINSVPIEEYLKGVIPSEMPLGRGNEYYEALKAFAICARTFTMQKISSGDKIFDVRTDVRDQVYGGTAGRQLISDKAVDATSGMIVTYQGKPATVFYSSTCGGYTEDIENVFGSMKLPYLQSIKDGEGPFCSVSPQAQWEEIFSKERIIDLLESSGKIMKDGYELDDIEINSRFRSGRVNELEIMLSSSNSVKLYGNNIRFVFLTSRNQPLNSNNFEIIKSGAKFIFKGRGWGHGVGLCQWGALSQSVKGESYTNILKHYFPGTEISGNND